MDLRIAKLLDIWRNGNIKLNPCQCLPLRYADSDCRLCVEHCPAKVIEIKKDSMEIIDAACTACGVCSSVCPTGVFDMSGLFLKNFSEEASARVSRSKKIRIECCKIPFKDSLSCGNSSSDCVRIPCLSHITPGILLKLFFMGAREIGVRDAGICGLCESKIGNKTADDAISKVNELAEQMGLTNKTYVIQEGVPIKNLVYEGSGLKDYKDAPPVSRRQVFSLFKKRAIDGIASILSEEAPLKIEEGKERLKKTLPMQRGELLNAMEGLWPGIPERKRANTTSEEISIYSKLFPTVTIGGKCNNCRLCVRFCPTGALTKTDSDKTQGIAFITALCTGCNLCKEVCAEGVISIECLPVDIDVVLERKLKTVIEFENADCRRCGLAFTRKGTEELCLNCEKEIRMFSSFEHLSQ